MTAAVWYAQQHGGENWGKQAAMTSCTVTVTVSELVGGRNNGGDHLDQVLAGAAGLCG